jgi:hypothetical protein
MSQPARIPAGAAGAADLRAALERVLGEHFRRPCRVGRLEQRPFAYRTSSAILELDAELDDGTRLPLLLKDTGRQGLLEEARRAKPDFLHDPLREIETYRTLLPALTADTALCYGAVVDPGAERYWLFLERVPGRELYQVGRFDTWLEVARWLADFHARAAGAAPRASPRLLMHDGDYYRLWMRRALAFARGRGRATLECLAARYDRVVERLLTLPAGVIHGEFYASNVLVQETAGGLRVCPVDWEMAAVGPGLLDLAALSAGGWAEEQRAALARSYREALAAAGGRGPGADEWAAAFDSCRLHLAVQRLGWAPDWVPPREQAQDWLGEALRLAGRLGL